MKPSNDVTTQNDRVADAMVELTIKFRNHDYWFPSALYGLLDTKGVDPQRSVMLHATTAEQGTNPVAGCILTHTGRFIEFDIDCDSLGERVVDVHQWDDATDGQDTASANPGYGKGAGCIALELQKRLNSIGKTVSDITAKTGNGG